VYLLDFTNAGILRFAQNDMSGMFFSELLASATLPIWRVGMHEEPRLARIVACLSGEAKAFQGVL
jgi:hypothetical protein